MKLYIYIYKQWDYQAKWLVGNGNSIPINYDFWLNVQNEMSTHIVNENLDL